MAECPWCPLVRGSFTPTCLPVTTWPLFCLSPSLIRQESCWIGGQFYSSMSLSQLFLRKIMFEDPGIRPVMYPFGAHDSPHSDTVLQEAGGLEAWLSDWQCWGSKILSRQSLGGDRSLEGKDCTWKIILLGLHLPLKEPVVIKKTKLTLSLTLMSCLPI